MIYIRQLILNIYGILYYLYNVFKCYINILLKQENSPRSQERVRFHVLDKDPHIRVHN